MALWKKGMLGPIKIIFLIKTAIELHEECIV